jgi:hypothetical protein
MKSNVNKKLAVQLLSIVFIILIITPVCNAGIKNYKILPGSNYNDHRLSKNIEIFDDYEPTGGTDFWALLVAVGVYENHPDSNRPSMLEAVDNLYDVLLDSPLWNEKHIHVLKAENATLQNLIKELLWLIKNEDKNDMSLIYITTHGSPLKDKEGNPLDIPPRDEDDGADEILIMYHGLEKWYDIIWDDLLNLFLRLLQSKGICLIIDSCYSGGFNDQYFKSKFKGRAIDSFLQGFGNEMASKRKVVLMSCEEDTLSYGSFFTNFLIAGFRGSADSSGNGDGINSAEEAFNYAESLVRFMTDDEQCPTMLDLYSGDFTVTFS